MRVSFDLSDADIKHFRGVMREVRKRAKNASEPQIIKAARGLLAEVAASKAPDFVSERIAKLGDLIAMLEDEDWAIGGRDRERVVSGLTYFADPDDLIPDKVPVFGYLDDAIMVELVVMELEEDLDAYADFCNFRQTREERFGSDEDPAVRDRWVRSRRNALHARIRRRRSRRRGSRASGGRSPLALF